MPRSKKSTATTSAEPTAVAQPEQVGSSNADVSDPAQSSTSAFGKQEHSGRIRGPVEEVIAKRVRTLGKKIQRFRVYAAQPIEKLNADQKAAIASLPILEAQSRELEDLIKSGGAVEVAELGEAAKLRGLKEEVETKARKDAESASSTHTSALAEPLSRFLNLYTLLHPARSADREHLTFSPLSLPSQLQDEVQATDVLRAGRMWEHLLAGGETAAEVLSGLVKGPTGDDHENDHIHHLFNLLSSSPSAPEDSTPVDDVPEPQPEDTTEDTREVIEVEPETTIEESTATLPNGHREASASATKGGAALNFLQDDELESGSGSAAAVDQEPEEGFEIVESAAPHETEHYDVPTSSAPEIETPADGPAGVEETAKPTFDWADEHDEPASASAAEVATTPAPGPTASASSPTPAESTGKPTEGGESSTSTPTPAPAAGERGGRGGRGGRGRGGAANGPRRGGNRPNGSNQETGQVNVPLPQHAGSGRQGSKAGTVVDEDGFEMKVKPSQRGRGGFSRGGRGGAREGGESRGGGRGRGGERAGRGAPKGTGNGGEGQQSRPPRTPQAQSAAAE